jgi:hydrogenase maturation factor
MSVGAVTVVARIRELRSSAEGPAAVVSVRGARMIVALELVPDARVGDDVLIHAGVAMALVREERDDVESREREG